MASNLKIECFLKTEALGQSSPAVLHSDSSPADCELLFCSPIPQLREINKAFKIYRVWFLAIKKASTMFGYILQEAFDKLDDVIKGNTITLKLKLFFTDQTLSRYENCVKGICCLFAGTW
jgi:hypothetical protein